MLFRSRDHEERVRDRDRERGRQREGTWALLWLGSEGEVSGVLQGHSLWANMKHEGESGLRRVEGESHIGSVIQAAQGTSGVWVA